MGAVHGGHRPVPAGPFPAPPGAAGPLHAARAPERLARAARTIAWGVPAARAAARVLWAALVAVFTLVLLVPGTAAHAAVSATASSAPVPAAISVPASVTVPATASPAAPANPGQVVVIGVPGLEWDDLDRARTPNLWGLAERGGSASMSTRAVPPPGRSLICPVAGWLTVSAGQRAGAPGDDCAPPAVPQPGPDGGASVPDWSRLTAHNAAEVSYRPVLGQLGQLVADAGGKVAAAGPGAALAAADKTGNIGKYAPSIGGLGDLAPYRLVVAEVPDLAEAWLQGRPGDGGPPAALTDRARREAVAAADRGVGAILGQVPPGATVLLGGLSDASPTAHLHVAVARGASPGGAPYPRGLLTAPSTRQDGLVTNTDLTATVIAILGLEAPNTVVGHAWRSAGPVGGSAAATVDRLADDDLASEVLREVRGPFFTGLVTVQILFYVLAAVAFRRGWGGSRALTAVRGVATVSGAIPVGIFLAQLVPWWSLPAPMAALVLTIVAVACVVAALALAGPWRAHVLGPLTVVAAITSLALLADVMTGSRLQVNAVGGYEPVTGGRFYGFGNIAFAIYSAGTILALAGIAQWLLPRGRRALALAVCVLYGGLAVFADGWPGWGADFGGVPAFLAGVAVLVVLLSGRRLSVAKAVLIGTAGVLAITVIAVADWLRPAEQRTHLGAFVQQVLDGEAWAVVTRKFGAMLGITVGNWPLTLLSLVALAFLFLVLDRPSRWGASALGRAYALAPALRAGLIGALVCALAGFLLNDSGIAIPAMALTVAVPLTLTACVRALRLSPPTMPGRASEPAGTTAPPAP
ncbi:hypothetical protein [Streptosporangium sandarakinum]